MLTLLKGLIVCLASMNFAYAEHFRVTDYQSLFLPVFYTNGELRIAIRVFKFNDIPSFLVVNPESLSTSIQPVNQFVPRGLAKQNETGNVTFEQIQATRYYQWLQRYTSPPYLFENQGMQQNEWHNGQILSIDLCPSHAPFEQDFFQKLVDLAHYKNQAIPITIAISGLWLINHPREMNWLIAMQQQHKFKITWVNHSFSHIYYKDLPYAKNFLLTPGTNLRAEILLTEQYLIEAGETPSVFFRFPGLVSDKKLIMTINHYGLIPLGANAWIAKQESIKKNSVILIHGNGNEHEGIELLTPYLKRLNLKSLIQNPIK